MNQALFRTYSRQEWANLRDEEVAIEPIEELADLVSLNDRLSQEDAQAIYTPLLQYIDILYKNHQDKCQLKQKFFHSTDGLVKKCPPFVVGITGSVAVGKSTTARVLHQMLQHYHPDRTVEMMTTDGFLYPNEELERRNLLLRKGFPESYDMQALMDFMVDVKTSTEEVYYPLYSHELYDIVPGGKVGMTPPDILIFEGINVLQSPTNSKIYISDFCDMTIYIDAEAAKIEKWYLERFEMLLDLAKDDPSNFYNKYNQMGREKALAVAKNTWLTVNMVNLVQHIAPTKDRADVIIHKTDNHYIDRVAVRNY